MWAADAYNKAGSILAHFLRGLRRDISETPKLRNSLGSPAVLNGGIGTSFLPPSNKAWTAALSEACRKPDRTNGSSIGPVTLRLFLMTFGMALGGLMSGRQRRGAPRRAGSRREHDQSIFWNVLRPRYHNLREWLRGLAVAIDRQNWFGPMLRPYRHV